MKKLFFLISLGRSLCKYLLTWSFVAHYITNLLKKFPDGIVPGKSMCNLKNFFLRNFSGVLHDLLPEKEAGTNLILLCRREIWLGNSKKLIYIDHRPIKTLYIFTPGNSKMFIITSKYFGFFNNKPPASWVVHMTRDFLMGLWVIRPSVPGNIKVLTSSTFS